MNNAPTAVVAIGGNSLISDPRHQTVPDQFAATRETAKHLAEMVEAGWNIVITHGNGPQVGFILLRSDLAAAVLHPVPLDSCGADTQGAIGYMIQQCMQNEFRQRVIPRQAVTVVTQVLVDRNDPAFARPSKPIGSFYDEATARGHMQTRGWTMVEDAGRGWRRVVPSPLPQEIIEVDVIRPLIRDGHVVIAVGGGGIPVVRDESGQLRGVEAVIDKDYASSLLATSIKADLLLISTAVEQVAIHYKKPDQKSLARLSLGEAKQYLAEGHFPSGSMGPKIQAAIAFVESGGPEALITNPQNITRALRGETGTRIVA
ncbi:MAG: carbamate kinase [Chloroflexi bacterium]|nr:carbamate kinase [Chloroflexota bacterium]MBI3733364.1 carbamate kinase [Chloroflexota bacterium]